MTVLNLICATLMILTVEAAMGLSKKRAGRIIKQKMSSCEDYECRGLKDEDPNCIPKCASETCYTQIYAGNELEPGEIDVRRNREFIRCSKNDLIENDKKKRKEELKRKAMEREAKKAAVTA
ncbi:hypothetical protein AAMO2058_001663700 [Amorphochlora amoebiformis]